MPRNKPKDHTEKLILLHNTVIQSLTKQAVTLNMSVKNYIEYMCNIQSHNEPIKKIEF